MSPSPLSQPVLLAALSDLKNEWDILITAFIALKSVFFLTPHLSSGLLFELHDSFLEKLSGRKMLIGSFFFFFSLF